MIFSIFLIQCCVRYIYFITFQFMNLIGIIFILFGIIVIAVPELIAWLIGIFFILIGMNIFLLSTAFKNGKRESFSFGKYEIFRKK